MRVVVISSGCLSGEWMLAESLAEELGHRCIDSAVVVERAAAWGAPHAELWQALLEPPTPLGRLLHKRRVHLTLLQTALLEEIRVGDAICYGNLGELLPTSKGHTLTHCAFASLHRSSSKSACLGVTEAQQQRGTHLHPEHGPQKRNVASLRLRRQLA